jgi:hypothetical protein
MRIKFFWKYLLATAVGFAGGFATHWLIYRGTSAALVARAERAEELYQISKAHKGLPFTEDQVKTAIQKTYTLSPAPVHYQTKTGERTQWFDIASTGVVVEVIGDDPSSPTHVGVLFRPDSPAQVHAETIIVAISKLLPPTRIPVGTAISQARHHLEMDAGGVQAGGGMSVDLNGSISVSLREYPSDAGDHVRHKIEFVSQ